MTEDIGIMDEQIQCLRKKNSLAGILDLKLWQMYYTCNTYVSNYGKQNLSETKLRLRAMVLSTATYSIDIQCVLSPKLSDSWEDSNLRKLYR